MYSVAPSNLISAYFLENWNVLDKLTIKIFGKAFSSRKMGNFDNFKKGAPSYNSDQTRARILLELARAKKKIFFFDQNLINLIKNNIFLIKNFCSSKKNFCSSKKICSSRNFFFARLKLTINVSLIASENISE